MSASSFTNHTDLQALYAEGVLAGQHLVRRRQRLQAHGALQHELQRSRHLRRRRPRGLGRHGGVRLHHKPLIK